MDVVSFLILGFVVGVAVASLIRLASIGREDILDRTSRQRVEQRISELSAGARPSGTRIEGDAAPTATLMIRRRLVRDASTMLVVLGAVVILAFGTTGVLTPAGSVLEATATPGRPATGAALGSLAETPVVRTPRPSPAPTAAAETTVPSEPLSTMPPAVTATPQPSAVAVKPPPRATSDRMAVLTRCPDRRDCYIYVVRRGDNLVSIANWFGIPYETVLGLNPQIPDPSNVHAGNRIGLPTPTR